MKLRCISNIITKGFYENQETLPLTVGKVYDVMPAFYINKSFVIYNDDKEWVSMPHFQLFEPFDQNL